LKATCPPGCTGCADRRLELVAREAERIERGAERCRVLGNQRGRPGFRLDHERVSPQAHEDESKRREASSRVTRTSSVPDGTEGRSRARAKRVLAEGERYVARGEGPPPTLATTPSHVDERGEIIDDALDLGRVTRS
jgi:hypothetical protein